MKGNLKVVEDIDKHFKLNTLTELKLVFNDFPVEDTGKYVRDYTLEGEICPPNMVKYDNIFRHLTENLFYLARDKNNNLLSFNILVLMYRCLYQSKAIN